MWRANWKKLMSNPLNPAYWGKIFRTLTPELSSGVAQYMEEAIPWVEMISERSANSYCHLTVDEILKGICEYPGMGRNLLFYTLKSVVPRHRSAAVKILESWGTGYWPEGINEALTEAHRAEKTTL